MTITVRRATAADARVIATIRVTSWRAAYDGLMPDVLLRRLDIDREAHLRALHWPSRHSDPRMVELLAVVDGRPVGWASAGVCRDADAPELRGELQALYALPDRWSTGVGHTLITAVEASLQASGFTSASLWMLRGNDRAARFYQRHGWVPDGVVKDDHRIVAGTDAAPLREVRRVKLLPPRGRDSGPDPQPLARPSENDPTDPGYSSIPNDRPPSSEGNGVNPTRG